MSVAYPTDRHEPWHPASGSCFHCAQHVDTSNTVAVQWRGNDEEGTMILLHPACAADLGGHLQGDAREALLAHGEPSFWAIRAARAAGAALRKWEPSA
jgi:hypothetical protein